MPHPSGSSHKYDPAWLDRMKRAEGGSADAKTIGNDGTWPQHTSLDDMAPIPKASRLLEEYNEPLAREHVRPTTDIDITPK
jgi:hypothetical protein